MRPCSGRGVRIVVSYRRLYVLGLRVFPQWGVEGLKLKDEGLPLWRQIQRGIEDDIRAGILGPGSRLPAEPELALRYGAHRHTVRRAMADMAQRGIIRVEQGRGSFVHEDTIDYAVGRRTRVEDNLLRHHKNFNGRLLSAREAPADAQELLALKLRGRAPKVMVVETLNEADGMPISIVRHVLAATRFSAFPAAYDCFCGPA